MHLFHIYYSTTAIPVLFCQVSEYTLIPEKMFKGESSKAIVSPPQCLEITSPLI